MPANVSFSVRNGALTIVIGASAPSSGTSGSGCCCPTVIGPIVIDGRSGSDPLSATGGSPPDPSGYGSSPPDPSGYGGSPPDPSGYGGSPPDPSGYGGSPPDPSGYGSSPPDPSGYGSGVAGGGSVCCAPTVIGPVIFTSCGCGAATSAQPALPPSAAVAVNPPLQTFPPSTSDELAFIMQQQEELKWCWAAVAVSIHNFLDPNATPDWTQGTLATPVLLTEGQIAPGISCSATPGLCDFGAALSDALARTGNLRPNGALLNQHLVFNSLRNWIDQGFPVAARIQWFGGGAHFIAIDGYSQADLADPIVDVQDPFYGPSLQIYSDLVTSYPPGGVWQDTFLVQ